MVSEYKRQLAEIREKQDLYRQMGDYDRADRLSPLCDNLEYAIQMMGGLTDATETQGVCRRLSRRR